MSYSESEQAKQGWRSAVGAARTIDEHTGYGKGQCPNCESQMGSPRRLKKHIFLRSEVQVVSFFMSTVQEGKKEEEFGMAVPEWIRKTPQVST